MSEISTEELAQWLEELHGWALDSAEVKDGAHEIPVADSELERFAQAAARLRALAEDAERLDYVQGWIEFGHEINCGGGEVEMVDHDNAIAFVGADIRQAIDKARHD